MCRIFLLTGGDTELRFLKFSSNYNNNESKVSPDQASLEQFRVDAAQLRNQAPSCEERVSATWLTSYPGSGSKLTWKLIKAITGDDYDYDYGQASKGVVVAVKTHFPSTHTEQRVFQQEMFQGMQRSIMLIFTRFQPFFRFVYFVKWKRTNGWWTGPAVVVSPP